jgi:hypothetical protein
MMDLQGNSAGVSCDNLPELCRIYQNRAERIKLIENKETDKLKKEIDQLKKQRQTIGYRSIKELLTEFGLDTVLSEGVRDNKLLC